MVVPDCTMNKQGMPLNQLLPPHDTSSDCRIACLSDTYGASANNGVGRFLQDLRTFALQRELPLQLVVPGKDASPTGLHCVRAPTFPLPGYEDLRVSMPLEHHRKTIHRLLKQWHTNVVHVSTPGPFGCLGIKLAQQLRLPLVGIYHTDFPAYVEAIVRAQVSRVLENPRQLLTPVRDMLRPLLGGTSDFTLTDLEKLVPELGSDLQTVRQMFSRNTETLGAKIDVVELLSGLGRSLTERVLARLYSYFTLVISRSPAHAESVQQALRIPAERVRCLVPGTDIEKFHPKYKDADIWEPLGFAREDFVALYVGRITPEKNFKFLLEVWRQVLAACENEDRTLRLVVVGNGDADLLSAARELPGVHTLGAQFGARLSALYASADALLFPSLTETLGQVGLEAGASGLPVLVADRGGQLSYVEHERTGYVLSTKDPQSWAARLLGLSRDEALRISLAQQARTHIANNHTLEASLLSYFEIHREAAEQAKANSKSKQRTRSKPKRARMPLGMEGQPGLLVITDYHAGKRFGSRRHRSQKEAALEKMLRKAVREDLTVIFGGDFGDHGSRPGRLLEDFEVLRDVRKRVRLNHSPIFVRGNHDYGFTDEQLVDFTGGCHVHDSLVYRHEPSRITFTHGHILGLSRVLEVIRSGCSSEQLEQELCEDRLDQELQPAVIAYDLANLAASYLHQQGLTGLGDFWEGLIRTRAALSDKVLHWSQRSHREDRRTWNMIASLIGTHNDVETAALLGAAQGSWASIFGHTHDPSAHKLNLSTTGLPARAHLVGNAGNMNRKRPCCIVARFPELCVLRYRHELDELRPSHRVRLTHAEIERYEASLLEPRRQQLATPSRPMHPISPGS